MMCRRSRPPETLHSAPSRASRQPDRTVSAPPFVTRPTLRRVDEGSSHRSLDGSTVPRGGILQCLDPARSGHFHALADPRPCRSKLRTVRLAAVRLVGAGVSRRENLE